MMSEPTNYEDSRTLVDTMGREYVLKHIADATIHDLRRQLAEAHAMLRELAGIAYGNLEQPTVGEIAAINRAKALLREAAGGDGIG